MGKTNEIRELKINKRLKKLNEMIDYREMVLDDIEALSYIEEYYPEEILELQGMREEILNSTVKLFGTDIDESNEEVLRKLQANIEAANTLYERDDAIYCD